MLRVVGPNDSCNPNETPLHLLPAELVATAEALNAEIVRAQAAESTLTAYLNSEVTARQVGDANTLSAAKEYTDTSIANEATICQNADTALQEKLDAEITARGQTDIRVAALQSAVATLQGVVTAIQSSLAALQALVASLQTQVDTLTAGVNSLVNDLAAEATARQQTDASLQQQSATLQTTVTAHEGRITVLETQVANLLATPTPTATATSTPTITPTPTATFTPSPTPTPVRPVGDQDVTHSYDGHQTTASAPATVDGNLATTAAGPVSLSWDNYPSLVQFNIYAAAAVDSATLTLVQFDPQTRAVIQPPLIIPISNMTDTAGRHCVMIRLYDWSFRKYFSSATAAVSPSNVQIAEIEAFKGGNWISNFTCNNGFQYFGP